jgi:PKD repeat protein
MKKHKIYFFLILFLISGFSFSQTAEQKAFITKDYDKGKLKSLADYFYKKETAAKKEALEMAKRNNWPVKYEKDGRYYELMEVSENVPIYYVTTNVNAAKSTRANTLHDGGLLNLNIEGQNMTAYIWDGGIARETHVEYDGLGGNNRYSVGDETENMHAHSGHVAGTIIASGVSANAKGMAPQANAIGYDWNHDLNEATTAAADGALLSNHSYGWRASQIDDWWFGAYLAVTRDWDEVMYNAPYYLMVVAAGNDGNDNDSNGSPLDNNSSFDKLSGHCVCKNNLVVANGQDANIDANGNLINVARNSSSSEGPTDDYRIKPDIMGNGTSLHSTLVWGDAAYGNMTGTSMASPNVCGTLLLLQQYYHSLNNEYMRAATLKGLALHTADDIADPGPDPERGWGLMNAKEAAETIRLRGSESIIDELTLNENDTYTIDVESDGNHPLIVSISWTDPAGPEQFDLNDHDARLVNDLDLKVTQNQNTYLPYKLTAVNQTGTGDNDVDPFEKIVVNNAAGTYTITVNHEGDLTNDEQNYSLIITGISLKPDADFVADNVTPDEGQTVSFTDQSTKNPTSWAWSFDPNTVTYVDGTNANSQNPKVTFDAAGQYSVTLTATNDIGSDTETKQNYIDVAGAAACPTITEFPYTQNFDAWDENNPAYKCTDDESVDLGDCWTNVTGDDFDWNVISGSTASDNTGPSEDHTSGNGKYLYTEASSCFNHTGRITSPTFNLSNLNSATLKFSYHMYGNNMGTLSVQVSTDGGATWSDNIWNKSGDQGNSWKDASVSLNDYLVDNFVVRFTSVTGPGYASDIAIDDFQVVEEEGGGGQNPEYCDISYSTGTEYGDYLSLVHVQDINHATGALDEAPFYIYYDNISTDLTIGSTYTLTVKAGTYDSENDIAAWIDYNQDGTFDNDEKLGQVRLNASPETGDIEFTVPDEATSGTTRFRVREAWRALNMDPCSDYQYGETEDYNVNLVNAGREGGEFGNDFVPEFEVLQENDVLIYSYNKTIYIRYNEDKSGDIVVYSLSGNVVAQGKAVKGINKIKIRSNNKFYVVRVISSGTVSVQKVFVR